MSYYIACEIQFRLRRSPHISNLSLFPLWNRQSSPSLSIPYQLVFLLRTNKLCNSCQNKEDCWYLSSCARIAKTLVSLSLVKSAGVAYEKRINWVLLLNVTSQINSWNFVSIVNGFDFPIGMGSKVHCLSRSSRIDLIIRISPVIYEPAHVSYVYLHKAELWQK